MTRRLVILLGILTISMSGWSVTQEGNVRTISRKGKAGSPVAGAVIRLQGSHNRVQSRENGDFSIVMHNMQNGDAYAIGSIVKTGYEPAEQELIGKRLPCSDQVPLEILLVSRLQLMEEREAIEAKARENVEIFYQARLDSLEMQLATQRISAAEMAEQKQRLESQYDNFEPLLRAMSDVLARTDYHRMDSLTILMQQAIEEGNPEEAERLLREKGSIAQRKTILAEWGKNIAALQLEADKNKSEYMRQKREFEDDCYRLYCSFLSRFQNDSAGYYLQERAASDTANLDYQLQAGQFAMNILADYPSAKLYFERAYRIAVKQYGELSGQMATTCNELGYVFKKNGDLDTALEWYNRSLSIRENIRGKNSPAVAEALNNLGELYSANQDLKNAMKCHQRALKIREKHFENNSLEIAESKNNIGGVYTKQGQYAQAQKLFKEVNDIYSTNPKVPQLRVADNLNNLGGICYFQNKYEEALEYFKQSASIYLNVLGENHPRAINAQQNSTICKQKIQAQN